MSSTSGRSGSLAHTHNLKNAHTKINRRRLALSVVLQHTDREDGYRVTPPLFPFSFFLFFFSLFSILLFLFFTFTFL